MKVGLLAPCYGPEQGPLGRDVYELARAIVRAGGQAEVLVPQSDHTQMPRTERGIVLRSLPLDDDGRRTPSRALRDGLSRHDLSYDLVHAHGYPSLPPLRAAGVAPRRLVFSPGHGQEPGARAGWLARGPHRRLAQWALAAADLVVCVSHEQATEVRRRAPRIVPRVRMVPGTAELTAIEAAKPFPVARRVILTIDSLQRGNGVGRVISTLPDLGGEYELVVIGQGRRRRALQAHAADLRVEDRVRFLGDIGDAEVYRWLRTANVVVAASQPSACGRALLEAIATGIPAVASDVSPHRLLASRLSPERLRLVAVEASPLRMAEEIAHATSNGATPLTGPAPTWKAVADHTVSLYETLLSGSSHPASAGRLDSEAGDAHHAAVRSATSLCTDAA